LRPLFKNNKVHRYVYLFGLALIIASLPLSKYTQTIGLLILFLNWIAEGNYKFRLKKFMASRVALVICSLYVMHLLGLLYTSDFNYAFTDLRTKIPLLALPLIIASSEELTPKMFRSLLLIFVFATLASTLISTYVFVTTEISDIRDICIFTSHIRLSLMISLSFFISLFFAFSENKFSGVQKIMLVLLSVWFIVFFFILESMTGLTITAVVAFIMLMRMAFRSKKVLVKISAIVILIAIPLTFVLYVRDVYKDIVVAPLDNDITLDKYTAKGNPYFHNTNDVELENGHYVWRYICESEMQESWNRRSTYNYYGKDKKGQELKSTLRRFLTSKGYRKDAEGVDKLTHEEVAAIENGISIVQCMGRQTIRNRIFETIWEYENYKMIQNPNEKSLMQRLEYWKASLGIIREHFLFGVGTGDMNIAFAEQYEKTNSQLEKQWRLRSHDQFLSIATGFGIIGLAWFLFGLFYPFSLKYIRRDFIYFAFFLILVLSMLTEDTIESQEGLYFYAIFAALLLLGRKHTAEEFENDPLKS
jgi:hypothetical protein